MFCVASITARICSSAGATCSGADLSYQTVLQQVSPQPTDLSTCAYVIASPAEVTSSIWSLTGEQGLQISAAVALLWGLGFAFRQLGQFFNESSDSNKEF